PRFQLEACLFFEQDVQPFGFRFREQFVGTSPDQSHFESPSSTRSYVRVGAATKWLLRCPSGRNLQGQSTEEGVSVGKRSSLLPILASEGSTKPRASACR